MLGVPTVADRVAQTVVAIYLGERAEPRFHPDYYGYRLAKSALEALATCRQRCWRYDWVIDLDVQKFFDTVPWDLVLKAVEAVTTTPWALLYVRRWLAAPLQLPDGTLTERYKGTPQGSAVSPVLANLFMHFAFDNWMARTFPGCPFERYADDCVVHCATKAQGEKVLAAIAERMEEVGLKLHPGKTVWLIAKTANAGGSTSTPASPSWAIPSGPGKAWAKDGSYFTSLLARHEPRGAQGQRRPAPLPCGCSGAPT